MTRTTLVALAGLVVLSVVVGALILPRLERYFLDRTGTREAATLRLATEVMRGALDRTEALPALLAERPILAELLRDPENQGLLPFANEQLRQTALSLDVSDVYLMDSSGTTVAASSYRTDRSFVGRNFGYRPYFTQALSGDLGRFHGLGTTSGLRGYFFAAPVLDGTEIVGVIAVKITLDRFEDAWASADSTIIVTDSSNVVFLSDRSDWHFRTIGPLSEPAIDRITRTRQYPLARLRPLTLTRTSLGDDLEIITVGDEDFVSSTSLIAAVGWRVSILTPTGPALAQARTALAVIILAILIAGLIAVVFLQRRARLLERLEIQRSTQAQLEARVAERTADLNQANQRLRAEVAERTTAEQRLRQTQADLVQAGKLAALGQMSAALSHEFNQPLAAVKSYADNAATFLDRDRPAEARRNISHISAMADRMATISKHLRNFARRPQDRVGPIPLVDVLDDAVALMRPRLEASDATLHFDRPGRAIWVRGGRVRLQQVVVNLISNALDAMEHEADKRIEMSVHRTAEGWRVDVRDHGPGLSEGAAEKVFDPFFTTKAPGKGLGLGLSISYNIIRDFGGSLSARTHARGGAVFSVALPADEAPEEGEEGVAAE